jgi:type IV pilus assembly protein PilE
METTKPLASSSAGFSLIELLITVAIIGLLAAIAVPMYAKYIIRADRVAAQSEMMEIASREAQFLSADHRYADKTTIVASGYTIPTRVSSKYTYTITVTNPPTPTFLITFTPTGSQASDGFLSLNNDGVKLPAAKW